MEIEVTEGMIKEEITLTAKEANRRALSLMFPLMIMMFTPYYIIWGQDVTVESLRQFAAESKAWAGYGTLIIIITIILGIVVHEFIHGITWALFAKSGFHSIRFGVLWKELTPYCHCTEPLVVRQYLIGAMMPAIILGLIPTFVSYLTGNLWLMLFGVFFTIAAAGDVMMINIIRKEHPDDLVQDHPEKIGCFIFRKSK